MRPSMLSNENTGISAAITMAMANSVGLATATAESMMMWRMSACVCGLRRRALRMMFSASTTAPSTMMPKSMAPMEIRLAGMPSRCRPMKATSSDSGITVATISEPRRLRRNSHSTPTISVAPNSRLCCTVPSVWPTRSERS